MMRTSSRFKRVATTLMLACSLALVATGATRPLYAAERTVEPAGSYNTEYIYAATRGLNDADIHPALKVTLVPVTLVLDTAFLPFALIMGLF